MTKVVERKRVPGLLRGEDYPVVSLRKNIDFRGSDGKNRVQESGIEGLHMEGENSPSRKMEEKYCTTRMKIENIYETGVLT